MEPLEQFNFEEDWRRALADASEQPPASVWDKIEQVLDEKPERKAIFWLWLNDNRLRVAAGIALFFSFGFLIYKTSVLSKNSIEIASTLPKNNAQKSNEIKSKIDSSIIHFKKPSEVDLANTTFGNKKFSNDKQKINTNRHHKNNSFQNTDKKEFISKNKILNKENPNTSIREVIVQKQENLPKIANEIPNQILAQNGIEEILNKLKIEATILASKSKIQLPPNRLVRRLILDYEVVEMAALKPKKEFWLGLQSGGGSFNPSFSDASINSIAASSFESPYSNLKDPITMPNVSLLPSNLPALGFASPNNKTAASDGFRNGLTFGMKVSKNWSIESGIAYVRGNSYLQSNTYSIDKTSGTKSTYFGNFISNNSGNLTNTKDQNRAITTVADESSFLNRYEFVSIPIQAGYTFLAKRKLNFSLLGGVSADVFLENLIGGNTSLNVSSLAINQNDKIYKPLNISGLGTFRVNYRLQKNWSAYLGGQYQQGLGSLLLDNSAINLNLKQTGLQTGLNYKF